ncbi:MAG: class I SAM-dependent methyltransferase, partial [Candidatus Thorarchaeota archaeon]|nr:class I SAM-dependent methyltransferase [Candidatus Thorarchaeota archaeon]
MRLMQPCERDLSSGLRDYYDALAPVYDIKYTHPSIQHMRRVEWMAVSRFLRPGMRTALDLGCGTGLYTCRIALQGLYVTGVDISSEMLVRARRRAEEQGVAGRAQFVAANLEEFEQDEDFDLIVSMFGPLSHVRDLTAALRRVRN